jgi:hypothetical protein
MAFRGNKKVIEDLFRGFGITWRSLGQLLQTFSFILVLALPLVLMARRQAATSDVGGDR